LAQSVGVRNRLRPLAALLLLAVVHNGVATAWSAAPDIVPPADMGMTHHGDGAMANMDSCGEPANQAGHDCSDSSSCDCDCGCTATQIVLLRPASAARNWLRTESIRAPDTAGFRPGTIGAPFRPPA